MVPKNIVALIRMNKFRRIILSMNFVLFFVNDNIESNNRTLLFTYSSEFKVPISKRNK